MFEFKLSYTHHVYFGKITHLPNHLDMATLNVYLILFSRSCALLRYFEYEFKLEDIFSPQCYSIQIKQASLRSGKGEARSMPTGNNWTDHTEFWMPTGVQ